MRWVDGVGDRRSEATDARIDAAAGVAEQERTHESSTQGGEQEGQPVPKCVASSLPDHRDEVACNRKNMVLLPAFIRIEARYYEGYMHFLRCMGCLGKRQM